MKIRAGRVRRVVVRWWRRGGVGMVLFCFGGGVVWMEEGFFLVWLEVGWLLHRKIRLVGRWGGMVREGTVH